MSQEGAGGRDRPRSAAPPPCVAPALHAQPAPVSTLPPPSPRITSITWSVRVPAGLTYTIYNRIVCLRYPGPQTRAGARCKRRRTSTAPPRPPPPPPPQRRAHRRPRRAPALPSARLYRPPPPRAAPPPLVPRAAWPPPPPPRALETASRVALRLASHRDAALAPPETARRRSPSGRRARPRRLVVTLPDAGDSRPARLCDLNTDSDASTPRPRPRLRPRPRVMAAPPRHSASPEDRSDGNDPLSAPSEYLAEVRPHGQRKPYRQRRSFIIIILRFSRCALGTSTR